MKDIKLLETCKNCNAHITLMESISADTGKMMLVKRCLNCGDYMVTEVAEIANNQVMVKVFKVGDGEWYASTLEIEDFICWFRKNIDNSDTYEELLENIEECDLDKDCMWYPTENKEDIEALGDNDESGSEDSIGDLRRSHEDDKIVEKLTSYREVIKLQGLSKEPYCIATNNY